MMSTGWRGCSNVGVWSAFWLWLLWCLASPARADEVLVAVATNFLNPMKELAGTFEESTGHRATLSGGSSGKLYAQIRNGAPFEVFLSADADRPRLLEAANFTVNGSRFTYAIGRVVLWSSDSQSTSEEGQEVLAKGNFTHLAIANPKTAPYGLAAVQVMKQWGLWESLRPRIVQGENIGQTFQFVASGNAQLGFVALSQISDPRFREHGTRWDIPTALYAPLSQDAVLLKPGQANPAAAALLEFFRGDEARAVIARYGYVFE